MPRFGPEEGKMDECYLVTVSKLSEAISISVPRAKTVWGVHPNFRGEVDCFQEQQLNVEETFVESAGNAAARKHNSLALHFLQVFHFWSRTREKTR